MEAAMVVAYAERAITKPVVWSGVFIYDTMEGPTWPILDVAEGPTSYLWVGDKRITVKNCFIEPKSPY